MTDGRVPGSWRDPTGHVLRCEGRHYRALRPAHHAFLEALRRDGHLGRLEQGGLLVRSAPADVALVEQLRTLAPGYDHFLELESLPFITVPAEWTVSMLADAGELTLRLQTELSRIGATLQDATAHNIQFVPGAGARFIDHGSLIPASPGPVWRVLGQFHRHFTIPLLLARHQGWDLRAALLGALDGRSPAEALRTLGPLERWWPRWLGVVTLPALLAAGEGKGTARPPRPTDAEVLRWTLERERRRVARLADGYLPAGHWSGYADDCHYRAEADGVKRRWVADHLSRRRPEWVLDLGANTGVYSGVAAAAGAKVVALEGDHDAAERLWRGIRGTKDQVIPVVADLAAPTPGLGFRGEERAPLLERLPRGTVLALALVHHLLVRSNLPLEAVRDLLAELAAPDLLLEYVPPGDPMFRRIARDHSESFEWFTLARCKEVFAARFDLIGEVALPGSERVGLTLRLRAG